MFSDCISLQYVASRCKVKQKAQINCCKYLTKIANNRFDTIICKLLNENYNCLYILYPRIFFCSFIILLIVV